MGEQLVEQVVGMLATDFPAYEPMVLIACGGSDLVTAVNEQVLRTVARPAREVVGMPVAELLSELGRTEGEVGWEHFDLTVADGMQAIEVWCGGSRKGSGPASGDAAPQARQLTGCLATDLKGRVTFFSSGAEQLLRCAKHEVVGRTVPLAWFDAEQLCERARALEVAPSVAVVRDAHRVGERRTRRAVELGCHDRRRGGSPSPPRQGGLRAVEWRMRRSDASLVSVELTVQPLKVDGQVTGYLVVGTDVGHRDHVHRLLTDVSQALSGAESRADHFSSLQHDILQTIQHELRTPVTALVGMAEVLLDEDAGPISDTQRGLVEVMGHAAARLQDLAARLTVAVSLLTGGRVVRRAWIDIAEVVAGAVQAALSDLGGAPDARQVTIATHGVAGGTVSVDPHLTDLAVRELVRNAALYGQGEILVAAEVVSEPTPRLELTVADQGPGLAPHELEDVLEPFVRGTMAERLAVQGCGLGLPMVTAVARLHGGAVQALVRDGGFSVQMVLPLQMADEQP